MDTAPIGRFHKHVFWFAIVVNTITAWFSSGWYAADEHYQTIVFAQEKLGEPVATELPWEYDARIRSALLPTMACGVISFCRATVHADPFTIAFVLRLITAMCALWAVRTFVNALLNGLDGRLHIAFILLSYGFWCLPYQHVRFSAETWSGLLFMATLAQVVRDDPSTKRLFLAGAMIGICVELKPAMIVPCMAISGWLMVARSLHRGRLIMYATSIVLALAFAFLIDHWFYGGYPFTLGNYLHLAITGDPSHSFETYPWYYYFAWVAKYATWPIGVLLLLALSIFTVRAPGHWLVWCIWPYLIVLSIIPHKELRSLFPLSDLMPLVLVAAWGHLTKDGVGTSLFQVRAMRYLGIAAGCALLLVNTTALFVSMFTPAGSGRTRLADAIAHLPDDRDLELGYAMDRTAIWDIRIPGFYLPGHVHDIGTLNEGNSTDLVITSEQADTRSYPADLHVLARSEPQWATPLLDRYNSERDRPFLLCAHKHNASLP